MVQKRLLALLIVVMKNARGSMRVAMLKQLIRVLLLKLLVMMNIRHAVYALNALIVANLDVKQKRKHASQLQKKHTILGLQPVSELLRQHKKL